jgi:hypothetical protein
MHAIKSCARHISWKNDGDSKYDSYNPFLRSSQSRTSRDDEEASTSCPRLEAAKSSPGMDTMANLRTEAFPRPPTRANTLPAVPTTVNWPAHVVVEEEAKEYYNADAIPTTVEGENDVIVQSKRRARFGLAPVKENSESGNEKSSGEDSDDDNASEERSKRCRRDLMKKKIPVVQQVKAVIFPQLITVNWLFFASPVAFGMSYAHVGPIPPFILHFISIFPYANTVVLAGEELNLRSGELLGSLIFVTIRFVYNLFTTQLTILT